MADRIRKGKQQSGTTLRISEETKARMGRVRHPGQSYDGLIAELLDLREEYLRTLRREGRLGLERLPETPKKSQDDQWWWTPRQ